VAFFFFCNGSGFVAVDKPLLMASYQVVLKVAKSKKSHTTVLQRRAITEHSIPANNTQSHTISSRCSSAENCLPFSMTFTAYFLLSFSNP